MIILFPSEIAELLPYYQTLLESVYLSSGPSSHRKQETGRLNRKRRLEEKGLTVRSTGTQLFKASVFPSLYVLFPSRRFVSSVSSLSQLSQLFPPSPLLFTCHFSFVLSLPLPCPLLKTRSMCNVDMFFSLSLLVIQLCTDRKIYTVQKANQRHLLLLHLEQSMVVLVIIFIAYQSLGPESSTLWANMFYLSVNDPLHQSSEVVQLLPYPRLVGILGY